MLVDNHDMRTRRLSVADFLVQSIKVLLVIALLYVLADYFGWPLFSEAGGNASVKKIASRYNLSQMSYPSCSRSDHDLKLFTLRKEETS